MLSCLVLVGQFFPLVLVRIPRANSFLQAALGRVASLVSIGPSYFHCTHMSRQLRNLREDDC